MSDVITVFDDGKGHYVLWDVKTGSVKVSHGVWMNPSYINQQEGKEPIHEKKDRPSLRDLVNWSQAPVWAEWAAQNEDGHIVGHEYCPVLSSFGRVLSSFNRSVKIWTNKGCEFVFPFRPQPLAHDWTEPLQRPKKTCPRCGGTGVFPAALTDNCAYCNGTGQVNE